MENETVCLWNKKQSDLTVGDNVIIGGATLAVGLVAPFAIMVAVGGAMNLFDKIRSRKNVVVEVIETTEV